MLLPVYKDSNTNFMLMQNKWSSVINPVLENPTTNPLILKNIELLAGTNIINHLLGRKLQGWKIVRQRALASIYDTQDSNIRPELTLLLVSDNPVSIDLEIF